MQPIDAGWLFADTVDGANANAIMYSIMGSAKLNNLNIYKYINYLLSEIPQLDDPCDVQAIEKYLPWNTENLPDEILNCQSADPEDSQIENRLIVE